jgi:hypothetical protein
MDIYDVVHTGRKKFKLLKRGNKRAVRIYPTGLAMRADVSFYLFNRDCQAWVHNKDGSIARIINSKAGDKK